MPTKPLAVLFAFAVCLAALGPAARRTVAQSQGGASQPPPGQPAPPQFRAGVELVQVDVSVLDRDRRPVRGLKAEDFTILEDGTLHPVSAFSEIVVPDAEPPPTPWMREVTPDVRRNDEHQDRRLTVIVMDDMTIPFDVAMIKSAKAIGQRLVDEMGAADVAAVIFTRSNREAQDFTGDRARLIAAVDKFAPGARDLHPADEDQQEYYFLAALGTLRRAAELLAAVPQRRKTLVYVSTGIPFDPEAAAEVVLIGPGEGQRAAVARRDLHNRLKDELEDIFREAQRANVNIYSVDPSGLGGMDRAVQLALARGSVFGAVAAGDQLQTASRQATLHAEMLRTVAENTGGRAFLNTNEFDSAVEQIFLENGSYYLLGYRSTNLKRNGGFRRLEVKVNRPDVEVRARNGYYGTREADTRRAVEPASELTKALSSLLPKGDLPMQVSAVPFAKPGSVDSSVAIVLGLRQPGPAGAAARVTEQVNLAVNAFGTEGQPRGSHRLKAELLLRPVPGGEVQYEVLSQIDLRPGRYQLRLAAESTMLGKTGSVFYDIDVPDFSRPALSLSGVTMTVEPALAAAPRDRLANLLPLVPSTQRDFLKTDKVRAFVRVYQSGRRPVMPITLDARVLDSTGRMVFGGPEKLGADRFLTHQPAAVDPPSSFGRQRMGAAPRAATSTDVPHPADVLLDLPVFSFSQGPHVLIVEVSNGNETARREVRFRIR
jgi:VWFA-related protein